MQCECILRQLSVGKSTHTGHIHLFQKAFFIDDTKGHLESAEKLGITTILFEDVKSSLSKIQELTGVDVSSPLGTRQELCAMLAHWVPLAK